MEVFQYVHAMSGGLSSDSRMIPTIMWSNPVY